MTDRTGEAVVASIESHRELLQALSEHFMSISARVTSADRSVVVEVDASGRMAGLWLDRYACRNGAEVLSATIVETAGAAADVVRDRQNHLVAKFSKQLSHLQQWVTG